MVKFMPAAVKGEAVVGLKAAWYFIVTMARAIKGGEIGGVKSQADEFGKGMSEILDEETGKSPQ